MEQPFTQDDIKKLEQYNQMAQAYHAFKGYQEQIRDIKTEIQSKAATTSEYKEYLQQQLAETHAAQEQFMKHCFDTEKGVFRTGDFTPPPNRDDMALKTPSQLDARMQKIEQELFPRVEHANQMKDQQLIHPTVERAYTTMQAEKERRQHVQIQEQASQVQTSSSQLSDQQLVKVMQYYDRQQKDAQTLLENVNFKKEDITHYVQEQQKDAITATRYLTHKHAEQLARIGPIDYSYQPPHTKEQLREAARQVSREALDEKARSWQPYQLLTEREMLHMARNDEYKRGISTPDDTPGDMEERIAERTRQFNERKQQELHQSKRQTRSMG